MLMKEPFMTTTTMDNWDKVVAFLEKIPVAKFVPDLDYFYDGPRMGQEVTANTRLAEALHPDCKTLACGAGWLALGRVFGSEPNQYTNIVKALDLGGYSAIESTPIFCCRSDGDGPYDVEDDVDTLNDKQLLLYRIWRHVYDYTPAKALKKAEAVA
jgi:hypothetical protein